MLVAEENGITSDHAVAHASASRMTIHVVFLLMPLSLLIARSPGGDAPA
jgi:hypothetical protein